MRWAVVNSLGHEALTTRGALAREPARFATRAQAEAYAAEMVELNHRRLLVNGQWVYYCLNVSPNTYTIVAVEEGVEP